MTSTMRMSALPSINEIEMGAAVFKDDMPVWLARFGDGVWPFIAEESPLYNGKTSSSIVWTDYVYGKGSLYSNPVSFTKRQYVMRLTPEIVQDLKVSAVIHGYFPKLIKDSRTSKKELDPKTVKGRIDELAKFFSMVMEDAQLELGLTVTYLRDIPFSLIKKGIAKYPGRSAHLKRSLKLISDPMVQKNLSSPLQWTLLDITKSNLAWAQLTPEEGIQTLSDSQFLFLLEHCKRSIASLKGILGLQIHDAECKALAKLQASSSSQIFRDAIHAYYEDRYDGGRATHFKARHGVPAEEVMFLVKDAHCSAMMLMLLFTGMRLTESKFVKRDSLIEEHGYWFIRSKVVKNRPKNVPCVEGWLAVDLIRDAYDILDFVSSKTGNKYLFSSPYQVSAANPTGYKGAAINTKLIRWIKRIDSSGLFLGYKFSVHQCRETLVYQLAKQEVGLPFLSMQLKHFQRQFDTMPNEVTAGYGNYRSELRVSISNRIAHAREGALLDLYGEDACFAGGGGQLHKARIDTFFSGLGLYGKAREEYIRAMARRGVKIMPTSIGSCTKNFMLPTGDQPPPCYGDYQCDPNCENHVITERCATALVVRKEHALAEAEKESDSTFKVVWLGLVDKLDGHIRKLEDVNSNV